MVTYFNALFHQKWNVQYLYQEGYDFPSVGWLVELSVGLYKMNVNGPLWKEGKWATEKSIQFKCRAE